MPIELIFIGVATFLVAGILASKFAARSGIPALLLFLLIGMLAGSDGPGRIHFDQPAIAQAVGILALVLILFSGGLDTAWSDVRPVLKRGLALATLGVTITAVAVGVFVSLAFSFTLEQGILLGAIISSTDAAAVFALLRAKGVHLRARLKPLLELESGSNDPMAVFLTLGMIRVLQNPGQPFYELVLFFLQQMILGGVLGFAFGRAIVWTINRLRLDYDGLYPVVTVAAALLIYGLTSVVGGNGFLAVYLAGLVLGNSAFIHRRSLTRFHDGLAWLGQIAMFVTLGLQVFPSRLVPIAPMGLIIALFLIFVARPLSVFISLAPARMDVRRKLFISWVGLRGAAPIILGTFPLVSGLERADTLFHLVFFIVLTSVLLQGPLIVPVARLLGVEAKPRAVRSPLAFVMDDNKITNDLIEILVPDDAEVVGKRILDLNLPPRALIVLIGREGEMVVPNGGTALEAGDAILLLADPAIQENVRDIFTRVAAPEAEG